MALVLVLAVLVLLSTLCIGYFSTVLADRMISQNYADSAEAHQLAESAQNLVMSQIFDATTLADTGWCSQPGMIRAFDANGKTVRAYKLYSAAAMNESGDYNPVTERATEIPDDWKKRAGEFIDLNAPVFRSGGWRYPIADPAAEGKVEGFKADPRDGVAMPVRWLYLLQDGTMASGQFLESGQVRIANATKENPVTGRIAFWTDDETCKVNVNTASEGTFWDMPRTASAEDRSYAASQPVKAEFSRYPGHPATVCLSAVFPELAGSSLPRNTSLYALSPRISAGGSLEGTVSWLKTIPSVAIKIDRLYTSIDELLYTPAKGQNAGVTAETIDRDRFFLTVSSHASDLNLFNLPRVTLWPIAADTSRRTAYDCLVAMASTVAANGAKLYFSRQTPGDPTNDYVGDGNNQKLYSYLQNVTSRSMPGFPGGALESKYGTAERNQILTEIYDYVRCTNLMDFSTPASTAYTAATPAGQGQVIPIEIKTSGADTRGFGRFATIREAAIRFYATGTDASGKVNKIGAMLLFSTSTPGQGYTAYNGTYSHKVTTVEPFTVSNSAVQFQGENVISSTPAASTYPANDTVLGGDEGFGHTLATSYPFVVGPIPVSGNYFQFSGGKITVEIHSNKLPNPVQTLTISFPAVPQLPVPKMPGTFASTDLDCFKNDTVRSVATTDVRMIAALKNVPEIGPDGRAYFAPGDPASYGSDQSKSFGLRDGLGRYYNGASGGQLVSSALCNAAYAPYIPASVADVPGDWDNGIGTLPDGAYTSKPDEGCANADSGGGLPYFNGFTKAVPAGAFFAARQMASPVVLGSLPTGVKRGQPWETLLFCPNPAAAGHPGLSDPPDFLWLDLFTVPVVEPYPLSEPFAASGRINLNYQMVPFTGLTRNTAMRAALKSTKVMAIPASDAGVYKTVGAAAESYRYPIAADPTLKQFEKRFSNGDVFRSAAEICRIFLVPDNAPGSPDENSVAGWWGNYRLTGDNTREMPYNHLYPLLTTQSNSYRIYFRVQCLKKTLNSDPTLWDENSDRVTSEYRGSTAIERRLDPSDSRLKQVDIFSKSLTPYYRFQVLDTLPIEW